MEDEACSKLRCLFTSIMEKQDCTGGLDSWTPLWNRLQQEILYILTILYTIHECSLGDKVYGLKDGLIDYW